MTARELIVPGAMPSRDANGRNLPAKFRFYVAGTGATELGVVYTDNTLTVPLAQPILSDSAGRWPQIWADDANTFDVGWSDQVFDETIKVYSNVSGADDAVLSSVTLAQQAADQAAAALAQAQALALVVTSAAKGLNLIGTSASSLDVASATPTFAMDQANLNFAPGQDVIAAVTTDAVNTWLVGTVSAVSGQNVTVTALAHHGTATHAGWTLSPTPKGNVLSVAGLTGAVTASALKAALAIASTDLTDIAALRGLIAAMAVAL